MLTPTSEETIPLAKRITLLKELKDFSLLSDEAIAHIVPYLKEYTAQPHDIIIAQDKIGRDIFLIAQGQAKVLITDSVHSTQEIAEISEGELIGMGDSALFARNRTRHASIVAHTEMRLLHFSPESLRAFAKKYPELAYRVWHTAKQLQREMFIHVATPFSHLSYLRRCWLATRLQEKVVQKNEDVVKQGEISDVCYFLRSGEIGLFALNAQGQEELLETLTPGMLFGETALIEKTPHPHTARALSRSEIWMLHSEDLKTMVMEAENSAEAVMSMLEHRSLPKQAHNIEVFENIKLDNEEVTILKDVSRGKYFRLSAYSAFLWPFLDGSRSLRQLTIMVFQQFGLFVPGLIASELRTLASAEFITGYVLPTLPNEQAKTTEAKIYNGLVRLKQIAQAQFAIKNVHQTLQIIYDKGGKYFFNSFAVAAMSLICIAGFVLLFLTTPRIIAFHLSIYTLLWIILLVIPLSMATALFHELGHALATIHSGRIVNRMGVGWYWVGPIAFVDTSDMWLASRVARMKVNIAGIFVDLFMAGLFLIPASLTTSPILAMTLWWLSITLYFRVLANLDPMLEFDGYYVLMDMANKSNLRQSSVLWLVNVVPRLFKKPELLREYWLEPLYWFCCIIFLVISIYVSVWFATTIGAKILPFPWVSGEQSILHWLIPIFVIIAASATVVAEVRLQKNRFKS